MSRIATVIGASGLIGSHLLQLLLKDDYWQHVRIIGRRPLNIQHEKLEELVIDFSNVKSFEQAVAGSEVVFCAIGTTQKKVKGDKDAYRKVDYDIAVNAAKAAAKYGVFSFLLVSSVGANADNNNNFYIKLKGVVEETVRLYARISSGVAEHLLDVRGEIPSAGVHLVHELGELQHSDVSGEPDYLEVLREVRAELSAHRYRF